MTTIKNVLIRDMIDMNEFNYIIKEYELESKGELTPDIDPCYDMYLQMEDNGTAYAHIVVVDDILVGFSVILISKLPHYSTLATTIESIYILPEHRKFGTGDMLIKEIESFSVSKGVDTMFMVAGIGSKLNMVAKSFGFTSTNIVYTKDIRD